MKDDIIKLHNAGKHDIYIAKKYHIPMNFVDKVLKDNADKMTTYDIKADFAKKRREAIDTLDGSSLSTALADAKEPLVVGFGDGTDSHKEIAKLMFNTSRNGVVVRNVPKPDPLQGSEVTVIYVDEFVSIEAKEDKSNE